MNGISTNAFPAETAGKLDALRTALHDLGSAAVAFSAGVDSTFLLRMAHEALGDRVVAVTVRAPFVPSREIEEATAFCQELSVKHVVIDVALADIPFFPENPPDRCYLCKKALFGKMLDFARKSGLAAVLEGSNLDDDGDYRPGRRAIRELGIRSPLHDAGLTKAEIRVLSRKMGLPTADKPSFACLASRFPYGERITVEGLERVGRAEDWLRGAFHGLAQLRVRCHGGTVARIEVAPNDIPRLAASAADIAAALRAIGFAYVSLDLQGYRTGSLNETLEDVARAPSPLPECAAVARAPSPLPECKAGGGLATAVKMNALSIADRIIANGPPASVGELLDLLRHAPREDFHAASHRVTAAFAPKRFDFCGIVNARAGRCPENCKWCAQSAHWKTGCEVHGWIGTEACVRAAADAEKNGVGRIGIVTSGRAQTPADIDALCDALRAMKTRTRIHLCGSLGLLSEDDLRRLRDAGLERVHCNIETAPSFFPSLCSTHTQAQKLETLRAAKRLGLGICCGGIIGMGETDEQLVEFALALAEVAPASIPVNFLHPIAGTPLGARAPLPVERILDSIAILRLANPRTPLRFAGGRVRLTDDDARRAIFCGINAGIAGPLLTTPGADYADDRALAAEAGYDVAQPLRN